MPKILSTDKYPWTCPRLTSPFFCANRGIVYQTTCSTPPIRTVSLKKSSLTPWNHLQTTYWDECPSNLWSSTLMIAIYLHNQLPFASLDGTIPLHFLSPYSPLFVIPPWDFGYIPFVHTTVSLSKLVLVPSKGTCFGYMWTQKGYWVYYPNTHHYVMSATTDVTFHGKNPTLSTIFPPRTFPPLVVLVNPSSYLPHYITSHLFHFSPITSSSSCMVHHAQQPPYQVFPLIMCHGFPSFHEEDWGMHSHFRDLQGWSSCDWCDEADIWATKDYLHQHLNVCDLEDSKLLPWARVFQTRMGSLSWPNEITLSIY